MITSLSRGLYGVFLLPWHAAARINALLRGKQARRYATRQLHAEAEAAPSSKAQRLKAARSNKVPLLNLDSAIVCAIPTIHYVVTDRTMDSTLLGAEADTPARRLRQRLDEERQEKQQSATVVNSAICGSRVRRATPARLQKQEQQERAAAVLCAGAQVSPWR